MHIGLAHVLRREKPGQWLLLAAVLLALLPALLAAGASAQDALPARRAVMAEKIRVELEERKAKGEKPFEY